MKKTKEKAIVDITNIHEFRNSANNLEKCNHIEYSDARPALPVHPELESLIDNFLLNYLQNTGLIAYTIPDNISIIHPEPKYPEINHNSDNYSYYENLDDDSKSKEDRIQIWLSKVELPSREKAINFANMNHGKAKKKHNK